MSTEAQLRQMTSSLQRTRGRMAYAETRVVNLDHVQADKSSHANMYQEEKDIKLARIVKYKLRADRKLPLFEEGIVTHDA